MAEGSQTFEQDIARLITEGTITRDEGLATPTRRPTCCGACRTTDAGVAPAEEGRPEDDRPASPRSRSTCAPTDKGPPTASVPACLCRPHPMQPMRATLRLPKR
jgi:twitching motility protein PilU